MNVRQAPLIIDIAGTELSPVDVQRLQHPLVGGLVLFARNWRDRSQLTQLCRSIKRLRSDLLITVDQEGGRVQRFRSDGFTVLPAMARLGQLWRSPDAPDSQGESALRAQRAAHAVGYVMAAELRACGVDLSFAPVLDLDWGRSAVIGDRAFDPDARVVTLLARALCQGMAQAGMAHCGKHFPGHGWVEADSHVAVPRDARSLATLRRFDLQPYVWLGSALSAVMPAHVIYNRVDSRPAGFSARWLRQVLREQLQFDGAVFSDDLGMAAAQVIDGQPASPLNAALLALHAGCDMVLLCNQSLGRGEGVDDLINALTSTQSQVEAEAEAGVAAGELRHWAPSADSERRRRNLLPRQHALPWDALQNQPLYQIARREVAALCG